MSGDLIDADISALRVFTEAGGSRLARYPASVVAEAASNVLAEVERLRAERGALHSDETRERVITRLVATADVWDPEFDPKWDYYDQARDITGEVIEALTPDPEADDA